MQIHLQTPQLKRPQATRSMTPILPTLDDGATTTAIRFGKADTTEFTASKALAKAFDRLIHPITSYLPFGVVPWAVPDHYIAGVGTRWQVRKNLQQELTDVIPSSVASIVKRFNAHKQNPSNQKSHVYGLDLKAPEVSISDGKQFIPIIQDTLIVYLGIHNLKRKKVEPLVQMACAEYTQWLKTQESHSYQGFTLSAKDGQIIASNFSKRNTPPIQ